jgi:hypothetical protein
MRWYMDEFCCCSNVTYVVISYLITEKEITLRLSCLGIFFTGHINVTFYLTMSTILPCYFVPCKCFYASSQCIWVPPFWNIHFYPLQSPQTSLAMFLCEQLNYTIHVCTAPFIITYLHKTWSLSEKSMHKFMHSHIPTHSFQINHS